VNAGGTGWIVVVRIRDKSNTGSSTNSQEKGGTAILPYKAIVMADITS